MKTFQNGLIDFFGKLSLFDYLGFFAIVVGFIIFLVLALVLRQKTKLSLLFILMAFLTLFGGPFLARSWIHNTFFSHQIAVEEVKKLIYSDTLIVAGTLTYHGPKEARGCDVAVSVHKHGFGWIKDNVYAIKPFKTGTEALEGIFFSGDTRPFKVVIEPFVYNGDYNITLSSGCW